MHPYDYYAVTLDCEVYCLECADKLDKTDETLDQVPIYAGSEWDSYPVCSRCGAVMDYVQLTDVGRLYKAEIDISTFHEWITGFDDDDVIGEAENSCNCPLARWLKPAIGEEVLVLDQYIVLGLEERQMPGWARRFVHDVDRLSRDTGQREVTASLALGVLDNIQSSP